MRMRNAAWLICVLAAATAHGGDWPAFRGPRGDGISEETQAPLKWSSDENIRWKMPLPGPGNSSPIVCQGRVFVTCATDKGKQRSLYCFDRVDGKPLWMQTVEFMGDEPTHGTNHYCASTPACDGERVVVWHGSAGVYCYNLEGRELWSKDLGKFRHIWGYASSPVFYQDSILLNCGPGQRSFLVALDRATGEIQWQTDEPGGASGEAEAGGKAAWVGSWSTPLVTQVDGADQVLVSYPYHVNSYDPRTGKVLWSVDGLGDLVYTSVIVGDGIGVAMGGYHGPAIGFKLGGSGNVTESNRLWRSTEKNPQRIGSGIIQGGHIFMANEPGLAQCLEAATGKERWKSRLPGGNIWGSMVLAAGRFYVTTQQGTTLVLKPNPDELEVLAENALKEASDSTPAVSDGQIFLRTFRHVYCIAE